MVVDMCHVMMCDKANHSITKDVMSYDVITYSYVALLCRFLITIIPFC